MHRRSMAMLAFLAYGQVAEAVAARGQVWPAVATSTYLGDKDDSRSTLWARLDFQSTGGRCLGPPIVGQNIARVEVESSVESSSEAL
jgi:hypothetical protein